MGRSFGAPLVGGDTKPSPTRSVVSTVIGWGQKGRLAPRAAARPGDVVVTTGTVGRGGLAAYRWETCDRSPSGRRRALRELLDVRPRVREGVVLSRWAHAMLDTSDGIADASRLLAEASQVRIVIAEGQVPVDPGLKALPSAARARAIVYGGDYELLAALPPTRVAGAVAAVRVGRRAPHRDRLGRTGFGKLDPVRCLPRPRVAGGDAEGGLAAVRISRPASSRTVGRHLSIRHVVPSQGRAILK